MEKNQMNKYDFETDKLVILVQNMPKDFIYSLSKSKYAMDIYFSSEETKESRIVMPLSEKVKASNLNLIANEVFSELGINGYVGNNIDIGDEIKKNKLSKDFMYVKKQGDVYQISDLRNKDSKTLLHNLALPSVINLHQLNQCNLCEGTEVIEGVARTSNVGLLTAVSKAGKSQAMIELAIAIASGGLWFNKLQCSPGTVLFINLELDDYNFRKRFNEVLEELHIQNKEEVILNIDILNCRGYNVTYSELEHLILEKSKERKYKLIIIDPIYVIGEFDENSASQVGEFMRRLIVLSENTNSLIFITHHSSKGDKSKVSAIDRGSGSGSFARAADVLMDMSSIDISRLLDTESEDYYRIEMTLRNYPSFEPFEIEYNYPVHYVVNGLEDAPLSYGKKINKQNLSDLEIDRTIKVVGKSVCEVAKCIGVTEQTIKNRLKQSKRFIIKNNQILQKEEF